MRALEESYKMHQVQVKQMQKFKMDKTGRMTLQGSLRFMGGRFRDPSKPFLSMCQVDLSRGSSRRSSRTSQDSEWNRPLKTSSQRSIILPKLSVGDTIVAAGKVFRLTGSMKQSTH